MASAIDWEHPPEWFDKELSADFETRTRFPVCKLIDRLRTDWQDDHSLPVQLARAQIAALRTAGDPEGRYRAKWQLVRNLDEIGYNAEQVREMVPEKPRQCIRRLRMEHLDEKKSPDPFSDPFPIREKES